MTLLTRQLLETHGVSNKWLDIVLRVVDKVTQTVKPDVRYAGDSNDIGHYVQVKKVTQWSACWSVLANSFVESFKVVACESDNLYSYRTNCELVNLILRVEPKNRQGLLKAFCVCVSMSK